MRSTSGFNSARSAGVRDASSWLPVLDGACTERPLGRARVMRLPMLHACRMHWETRLNSRDINAKVGAKVALKTHKTFPFNKGLQAHVRARFKQSQLRFTGTF